MSFVDGLSATASATLKESCEKAIATILEEFKADCQEKAKKGLFELSSMYSFNVDHPGVAVGVVTINEGVYKNASHFEKRIKEEIKNLKLKRADVAITMTSEWRSGFYHNGSVDIEAEWPSKPDVAAGGMVKRESSAGGDADTGGLGRRVRSRYVSPYV